nr:endolytic transglycosylase MltG [bacterium]
LQVDATFKYINGKTTEDLTLDDLKIDSPYNTYVYRGLTPTPISNPGLDSIMAAVTPIKTKYLYFLTDNDGNMHYAETFEQHQIHQNRYLQ